MSVIGELTGLSTNLKGPEKCHGGGPENGEADQISDGVCRVLAPNPKDYTGTGTNTYIVGYDRVWIIDPGPDDQSHIEAVLKAVADRPVEGICVTHTHLDHSPAAEPLKQITGAKTYGFGALSPDILANTNEDVDSDFVPDVMVRNQEILGAEDMRLQAFHTPGHFPNHMCYLLLHKNTLFSGDHVMGWSTTVIVPPLGNLLDYMDSLDVLERCSADIMLPSHGEKVTQPNQRIDEVRQHRKLRHEQVRTCVQGGVTDLQVIVDHIYEGLSARLIEAAKGSVQAHMEVLQREFEVNETLFDTPYVLSPAT